MTTNAPHDADDVSAEPDPTDGDTATNDTLPLNAADTVRLDDPDTQAADTQASETGFVGAPDAAQPDAAETPAAETLGAETAEAAQPFPPLAAGTIPTSTPVYTSTPPLVTSSPRVRSGAIAWGAIVLLSAVAVLVIALNPEARAAYDSWQTSLTAGTIALLGIVALGVLILLFAVLSAIRRAQRRARGELHNPLS
ncbi:hypothetical protein [Humibacter ginsenosidimutans]|uniref:Uncharacterized protein n=1 Tax=Humibacter ginsenosidimutans TaxID=2599293 RepID=A0A5B8M7G4_9MICO|nr:hypothetical protein [Humibacter ginsenosidimutans]QDZ16141.1 hypothetical protein FPZ11_16470 [Humibacter ginsenosidimutans]